MRKVGQCNSRGFSVRQRQSDTGIPHGQPRRSRAFSTDQPRVFGWVSGDLAIRRWECMFIAIKEPTMCPVSFPRVHGLVGHGFPIVPTWPPRRQFRCPGPRCRQQNARTTTSNCNCFLPHVHPLVGNHHTRDEHARKSFPPGGTTQRGLVSKNECAFSKSSKTVSMLIGFVGRGMFFVGVRCGSSMLDC